MQNTDISTLPEDQAPAIVAVWLKRLAIALAVMLLLGLLGYAMKGLFSAGAPHKKAITTIKLLPDTPPPPPPPPKEQPKDQPQPKEVKVEPQPKPAEAPPAEQLKMEGAAGDGPSPFAAGTVNNEYKGGDTGTKIGGAGNNHQFDWFAGLLKSRIEDALAKDPQLASGKYKLVVHVWVKANGRIERLDLVGSSGDAAKDALIKSALSDMPALSEMPPEGLPQPIKLRITARSSG